MAISPVQTLEVPDVCHRWLENRGTVYESLIDFGQLAQLVYDCGMEPRKRNKQGRGVFEGRYGPDDLFMWTLT